MLSKFMVIHPAFSDHVFHADYPNRLNLIGRTAFLVAWLHLHGTSIANDWSDGVLVGSEDHACRVVQLDRQFLNAVCRHRAAVVCLAFSWLIVRI